MHLQRNATQRIPQLYLNNNFKFYIFRFFRTLEFLSGFIRFAKIQFEIISHCHYEGNARDKVGQSPSNPIYLDCHDFLRSLAMIMAKKLFLVFGIILIVAFYLIEKLKKYLCQRYSVGEGEQK